MTGELTFSNVVRRINERASTVAAFRAAPNILTTYIEGPTSINYGQTASWEAVYSCGQGPYSFEWSASSDGFSYFTISNSEVLVTNYLQYSTTYLRLKVTSADGQQASNYIIVYVDGGGAGSRIAAPAAFIEPAVGLEKIYPNPTNQLTKIDFSLGENCAIKLELVDNAGRFMKSLANGYHLAGKYTKDISTADLPAGTYICTLTAAGVIQSKRVVVSHQSR